MTKTLKYGTKISKCTWFVVSFGKNWLVIGEKLFENWYFLCFLSKFKDLNEMKFAKTMLEGVVFSRSPSPTQEFFK